MSLALDGPRRFVVNDKRVAETYSLEIFNAVSAYGGFAIVESVAVDTYEVSSYMDIYGAREYVERRKADGAVGLRVYFYNPGVWFGQVFVPDHGAEWPDFYDCARLASRNQILVALGVPTETYAGKP